MPDNFRPIGVVGRALPGGTSDNIEGPIRIGRRGETCTLPFGSHRHSLSDEGSYFVAQNASIDAATTLAGHAAPVLADLYTKPFLFMRHGGGVTDQTRLYLDYIHVQVITAGVGGTSDNWAAECDTGVTRNTSAGTALTRINPNMQSAATPLCTVVGGAPVAAAATSSQRVMGHGVFRPSIAITGDKYTWRFGVDHIESNVVASAITHHLIPMPPVILGPTDQFLLHLYAPSQSAAGVYKVSVGWWER